MTTTAVSHKPIIALFGAKGQVGFELRRSLAPLGEVHAITREQVDLTQPQDCLDILDALKTTIIVNAAAYTAVDKAESDADTARAVNALFPEAAALWAKQHGALFVHYSTDYVFDGSKPLDQAYAESDTPNPQSVYGTTKLAGEQAIQASGAAHLIFRTSWVYGAHGNNFAKTMLKLARERDALKIVADQWGAPTSASLIADVTAHSLQSYLRGDKVVGLYHLAASGRTNWCEYAKFVIAAANLAGIVTKVGAIDIAAITTTDYPTPAKRPANSRLVTDKLENTFGLHMPSWQSSLSHTLEQIFEREIAK